MQRRKKINEGYKSWRKAPLAKRLVKYGRNPRFGRRYAAFSFFILVSTTVLWSLLGAALQQNNADQLVNAYLLEDGTTFREAAWPDQHTFLFKWPLFLLVKLLGYSTVSFIGVTVAVSVVTIVILAYLLSRIERRPIILGSFFLVLASVLLMVPAQPYAGGLLPVNMAMLTTRNLEYILYIAGLYCVIRAAGFRSRQFWLGTGLLGLLVASDHLFLSVSLGGALLALIVYALREKWELVNLSVRWLMAAIAAAAVSVALLSLLTITNVTHISAQTLAGPYGLNNDIKGLLEGTWYMLGGLLTNFGANPAYDSLTVREIPQRLMQNFISPAGPAYAVNLFVFLGLVGIGLHILWRSLKLTRRKTTVTVLPVKLSLVLIWSTLAAAGLFVVTKHYYIVDARYLTLALFTAFIAAAAWSSRKKFHNESLLLAAPVFIIAILSGAAGTVDNYRLQNEALTMISKRSSTINKALANQKVDLLVGDYWRVIPVKQASGSQQTVLPLANCTEPRGVLTSKAWMPRLETRSFAYLLTLDTSLTDYPACSLQQVVVAYGQPRSSVLIAGSLEKPQEILLFYDKANPAPAQPQAPRPPAVPAEVPVSLSDLPRSSCAAPTIINIVAHQDDDLLFMNPDLGHSIRAGYCIRTIYLTAGDAGAGQRYWLNREKGSEAAYQVMTGDKSIWIRRTVRLPGGQYITVAQPLGNTRVSLIYLHLPDGNIAGTGFASSQYQSLSQLAAGSSKQIKTVDTLSAYTAGSLTKALADLLSLYRPSEIRTLSDFQSGQYTDHSDHSAAGEFARRAEKDYELRRHNSGYSRLPLRFYAGYSVQEMPPNVYGPDLAAKEAAFMAYAAFDGSVCRSIEECRTTASYGAYLDRQYTHTR